MDLMNFIPESDIVTVELKNPVTGAELLNEDKTPMTITLYAPHSEAYKDYRFKATDKRFKEAQEGDGEFHITAKQVEAESIELLIAVTKDWNITFGKEKPKPTLKNIKKIYNDVFWIRPQLEEGLQNSLDFIAA